MTATNIRTESPAGAGEIPVPVDFFIRGELVRGDAVRHRSRDLGVDFATPAIDGDALVTPRSELPPLLDVPVSEIIEFLAECGKHLDLDTNPYMQHALEHTCKVNPLPRRVIENLFRSAPGYLSPTALWSNVEANFANPAVLDGWVERTDVLGNVGALRAFPPRMVHMLAGNSPTGCISSIAQGALVKAVNVFKMPSSDPFTCVAILRTMADVDPSHPVVRSMSAVYWKGGDERVERMLYRPQYFDRIVAWGGGDAINNVIKYLGPGIQLVSFDPKTSISMIGAEAFVSDEVIDEVAELAASDLTVFNQDACLASRFIFVEGERAGIETFCEVLARRLAVDRFSASADAPPPSSEIKDEVDMLALMDEAKVWGSFDGRGLVVLTEEPVGFHPSNKTANVVHVPSLEQAVRHVNVATQTIGVYPGSRKRALRDRLASAGAQRVVRLGGAAKHVMGGPHDAMFPLQRFVHWMSDEDAISAGLF
ncbi:acyl-CoA reductase [Novosphingobium album (ex Hu et al. 2023)]|uniref:Acyl-CoA reductase n=1 Tax=Novosphingobium album (ex Hu et al. 2023) TaxID=2930093 RepID=A0ABT0B713_9SPHN|nr:acyl-CoA reductase [Novosphingobium album (ex Hu et al. 2023)]MCJ2180836.1 long-chain-fatty-acyl-CoA reductase [Novosphingobium album (ex Hu et al. 2023)]